MRVGTLWIEVSAVSLNSKHVCAGRAHLHKDELPVLGPLFSHHLQAVVLVGSEEELLEQARL